MLSKDEVIRVLKRSKKLFHKRYGVNAIYLYGSFSRDMASNRSDVDVLVDTPRKYKNLKNFLEMRRFLSKAFKRDVDLVYLDSLNPVIKEEIKTETIRIE